MGLGIKFDEELEHDLTKDDLLIKINQVEADFMITKVDYNIYSIAIQINNIEEII